ncbi:unnamed protein product [Hyaloperonospora brassicae]|nr:unnamed protein product [Hyaloperonospora brassicae]
MKNLEGCWYLDGATCSLSTLVDWEKSTKASKSYKSLLALRTVESFMFARSIHLNEDDVGKPSNDDDGDGDDNLFIAKIRVLVTAYKKNIGEQQQLPQLTSILNVEQRSREMLVMWIAFCLVHQRCVSQFPLCKQYNVALAWQDLKVAVLRDRVAITALQHVCKYIRGWNRKTQGPPLFHLTMQDATFAFALKYALSNDSMIDIYDREVESWDRYVLSKWKEVEEKRNRAAGIRAELSVANEKLQLKQRELTNERSYGSNGYGESKAVSRLADKVASLKSKIKATNKSLKRALEVPPAITRPLPEAKDHAMQVIFMLTMPRSLEILGSLFCTAQRALAPTDPTDEMTKCSSLSSTTWESFYIDHRRCQALRPTTTELVATTGSDYLPMSNRAQTVDSLYSMYHFQLQQVVSPVLQNTKLTWKDSAGDTLNPFAATQASITESFIERLPHSFENFQWMNVWPSGNAARGNLVYSQLNQIPDVFEKASFIALGSLRSFPNQQFRKLLLVLLSDVLPWSNSCVSTIVRQSLYQIGDITDEDEPKLAWKIDMLQCEHGLVTFCTTLGAIADNLEHTPRCCENVPLLSELSGYLHQFDSAADPVVKSFSRMARHWAENSHVKGESDRTVDRTTTLHQNRCILYGYALLAYTLGPLDDAAARDVCELIVLFRTSFLCASIGASSTDKMRCIEGRVCEMMARRIAELVGFVEKSGTSSVLTSLVSLVCPQSPDQLEWTRVSDEPIHGEQLVSCFESSEAHYAINLFTGVVLTDGNPPGGLPPTIREHPRFQTLFPRCNFEVFYVNGVFQSESLYCDRLYEFAMQGEDDLYVQELVVGASGNRGSTLQLCSLEWIKSLCDHYPTRLWELYSHWHWVEKHCLLFRPKEAKDRDVFFVATFDEQNGVQCFRVPYGDTKCSYDFILQHCGTYDRFVQQDEVLQSVFSVLTKFENEQFLHALRSPDGVLKIELPRFKLSFFLNDRMQFESVEHIGYVLATQQQFDDFLPRFERYLLLDPQDRLDTTRPELRMLLPIGSVHDARNGMVDIESPGTADSSIGVACFDVHRRLKTFETETISSRLLLAAVCVRAGTNIPSKRLNMTGSEAAVQILRACRSSRPYSEPERTMLESICKLSFRVPAVKILAVALLTKSKQISFLLDQESQMVDMSMAGIDEQTEYGDLCSGRVRVYHNRLRSCFRSKEERFLFGRAQSRTHARCAHDLVSPMPLPGAADFVQEVERKLQRFVRHTTTSRADNPLKSRATAGVMSERMMKDLQISWDCYQSQAHTQLNVTPSVLTEELTSLLSDVASRRGEMEAYLRCVHVKATSSTRDRLLFLANGMPTMTIRDIVQCSFDDEMLYALTQKLTTTSREEFKQGALRYMELCVLEDKVERLIWKAKRSSELSESELVNELLNVRQWQLTEYPYWLAFEVEGRLQIRHEQFVVAKHLINERGTVCQLNMGCGKTRVILPMLFLHFTRSNCSRVVRAHFLGPLLSETRQFMHRHLSASIAQLDVFEQPFDRSSAIDARRLELIHDTLQEIQLFGGIQMVSPEHRMSLELKRLELGDKNAFAPQLDQLLDKTQFVDVLDECDALLHHKYHLVYAVGTPEPLCNGVERWTVAEALLRIVADSSLSCRVKNVLQTPRVSCNAPDYATRLGAYPGTRLNTIVESTECHRDELKKALVLDLIDNAPFELMFLEALGNGSAVDALVTAITDPTMSLQVALAEYVQRFSPYMRQLLVMRGLLAFGVLEHCLEKRYRVDFGLPHPGTRRKKIAIPFRAADVPSERSEFSHPDVCIVLTLLGYYHAGLTKEEVRCTFQKLLRLDISEQEHQYDRWFASVEPGLNSNDREALHDVRHVSLADSRQFETLCRVYQYCMEAINFYLNTCVFPNDTQQYPQRLSRTAWNLAAGGNTIGFSGTNDNHRLLPLSVAQHEPNEPSLRGTNGKMIDKIMQVTHSYEVIVPSPNRGPIPWQSVLLFAMDKNAQCLIDTGALLAGVENSEAAKFLLDQLDFVFAGVTYFDSRKEHNCWMIAEKTRQVVMPLEQAPMLEKETFVIFDEARSRGSDRKLRHNAAAVLTLGPKLAKDKLMQGAGRMRQLGCDQTLWIASFDEVAQSISQSSAHQNVSTLTAVDVLNWVMDNTRDECIRGLQEWATSGLRYRENQLNPASELVDENRSLELLYQEALATDKIARIVESQARLMFGDCEDALVARICSQSCTYGLDDEVCCVSHTGECEREIRVETERNQIDDTETPECTPSEEVKWDYRKVLQARSVEDLRGEVEVMEVDTYARHWASSTHSAGRLWSNTRVFGTINFFTTVAAPTSADRTIEFLRVIDVMLVFTNGQVLLVSECEADHILALLWSSSIKAGAKCSTASSLLGKQVPACSFRFVNLAFACESIRRVEALPVFSDVHMVLGADLDQDLPLLPTSACYLYNGEPMLTGRQKVVMEPTLRALLAPATQREATLSNFVKSRGNGHKWMRSYLHELCCRMDLEECNR